MLIPVAKCHVPTGKISSTDASARKRIIYPAIVAKIREEK
jgi:hypothetical protein